MKLDTSYGIISQFAHNMKHVFKVQKGEKLSKATKDKNKTKLLSYLGDPENDFLPRFAVNSIVGRKKDSNLPIRQNKIARSSLMEQR